jgi:ribosome maturation factor RimP
LWYNLLRNRYLAIIQRVGFPALCRLYKGIKYVSEVKKVKGQYKKKRVVDIISELVAPFCVENNLILEDVEFIKEGPFRYLRVIIDKEDGVGTDDCQMVSKFLNQKLDKVDPIEEQYFLEVTSPGIERELKKPEDFVKFAGKRVCASLFNPLNGSKVVKGTLVGLKDNKIIINSENSGDIELPKDKVAVIKLVVDFDATVDNSDREEK